MIDLDTLARRLVGRGFADVNHLSLSADDGWIYFDRWVDESDVWRITLASP